MIYLGIRISNPFSERFKNLWVWSRCVPPNKAMQIEVCQVATILEFRVGYTTRQDHAGLDVVAALLGYEISFKFYDTRHWNYDFKTWEK